MKLQQKTHLPILLQFLVITLSQADEDIPSQDVSAGSRIRKSFSLFQLVKFKNDGCEGTNSRNGTCFTQEECNTRGGTASGTCASGYGVCCIFSLTCGSTSSMNCTYLTKPSNTAASASPCTYKICKCDFTICRIRLDFLTFQIGNPSAGTTVVDVGAPAGTTNADAVGDCSLDQFTLTSPGNFAPPVICGYNNGQHMIVDASDACHEARFALTGSASRAWDIKVTQYKCGEIGRGGDDGCLQYFTGMSGQVASYAFPTNSMNVPLTATHLQDQAYSMCWRTELGQCGICFSPVVQGDADQMQSGSFGLSNPANPVARGERDSRCMSDYLLIPHAQAKSLETEDKFVVTTDLEATELRTRVCGRIFSISSGGAKRKVTASVCTQSRPFRLGFVTDSFESAEADIGLTNEQSGIPGGIVGFHLHWEQQACA